MLDSLLLSGVEPEELLSFTVPGIHIEKYGSANQKWNDLVGSVVRDVCQSLPGDGPATHSWYALHLGWFAKPMSYAQDLDNFRMRPILDHLTGCGFWPDDNIMHVRAIYSEVHLVDEIERQRVEVAIYGIV